MGLTRQTWGIQCTKTFDAAHFLEGHEKCGNVHGHTYSAEFFVRLHGNVHDSPKSSNMVLDFGRIKRIVDELDHKTLNDVLPADWGPPTVELIAKYLLEEFSSALPVAYLSALSEIYVCVKEGQHNRGFAASVYEKDE